MMASNEKDCELRQSKIQNIGDSVLVPEVDTLPDEFIDEMVIETAEETIEVDGSRNFVTDEWLRIPMYRIPNW